MNYTISPDRKTLTLTVTPEEQAILVEDGEEIHSDKYLTEFCEHLLCNSELHWVDPGNTGDLTDAPMFGIYGEETTNTDGPYGSVHVGYWDGANRYQPILERWAWMSYEVRSLCEELRDKGAAILIS